MKILLIGNIGSGKTTLGKKIQEFTGFKFIQIDEIREKFFDKKVSEEYYCLYEFIKAIENTNNVILEFTGAGCHKFAVKRALELSNDKVIIIRCNTRKFSTILERLKDKELNMSFPFNTDVENHVQFIEEELNKGTLERFWELLNSFFIEIYMNNLEDLIEGIEKIMDKLKIF